MIAALIHKNNNEIGLIVEKISFPSNGCSEKLKMNIREAIVHFSEKGWRLINLTNQGTAIYLKFKRIFC